MQLSNPSLKSISIVLLVIISLMSCSVYQKVPVALETALKYPRPVKVVSNNSKTYKFMRLEKFDNQVFGISKKNSRTSKMLSSQIVEDSIEMPLVKILLTDEDVNKIYNKKSTDWNVDFLKVVSYGLIALGTAMLVSVIMFIGGYY